MKQLQIIATTLLIGLTSLSIAQTTISLPANKDVMLRNYPNDNTNYGGYQYITAHSWTNSGIQVDHRSLIGFDFGTIPSGSIIQYAELQLRVDTGSGQFSNGHQQLTATNEAFLMRVTSPWTEYGVTWGTQPSTTNQNMVSVAASTSSFQNYDIDVTAMVQDMVDNPSSSDGFLFKMQNESPYRRMVFASKDSETEGVAPTLVITYQAPTIVEKVDRNLLDFSIYPNPSSGVITIGFEKSSSGREIEVYDLIGQKVQSADANNMNITLDLSDQASGMYFIRVIEKGEARGSKRVILN